MKVRNKEHQSLGIEELKELTTDFPNDADLGKAIRTIVSETAHKEVFDYYSELQKDAT
jgi:hypothetical protein